MENLRAGRILAIAGCTFCCGSVVSSALAQSATQPMTTTQATQRVPKPVAPVYSRVKNLFLTTELVKGGQANAVIVIGSGDHYAAEARSIQQALKARTGVTLPIVTDRDAQAAVPLTRNLILLGNRSTNAAVSKLYDQFYTLTDLKYPGPNGYEVRTLHNPFGNGINAVLLGGSDDAGVRGAATKFAEIVTQTQSGNGKFALGRLMEIKLGDGVVPPKDLKDFRIWEASDRRAYGEAGYFGWNSISKLLAMYYMTGNEASAREALRLSFPDAAAKQLINQLDGELIENKDDPLAGPYHYGASMMILFWDLVEESPVFTDEERLKVTNAFSRQLTHREGALDEGGVYYMTRPEKEAGDRHTLYAGVSLYALGRYFAKDYQDAVWRQSLTGVSNFMAPLRRENFWVGGENDNLFWYATAFAPILQYVLLSGDPSSINPKGLASMLRVQEVVTSGATDDPNTIWSTLDFWNKVAHLTGDGRWLTYRNGVNVDPNVFRLGQSYWPAPSLKPAEATDLYNRWTITRFPASLFEKRNTGFSVAESFTNASFRDGTNASGDFMLIDGMNGGKRNPYHTFAVLDLRIKGQTLLRGYLNQIQTKADGMVEPKVALDAALKFSDVLGQTVAAEGYVPNAAFCDWRRTVVQRKGRYALIADDLGFRADSDHFEVQLFWQRKGMQKWTRDGSSLLLTLPGEKKPFGQIAMSELMPHVTTWDSVELTWEGKARRGAHKYFFSLVGPAGTGETPALKCVRLAPNAAALNLPQPAIVVSGQYQNVAGDLVLLGSDHLFGRNITRAALGNPLLTSDKPSQVDWDFSTGELTVVNEQPVNLSLALAPGSKLQNGGKTLATSAKQGMATVALPAGRHLIQGARLDSALLSHLNRDLAAAGANQATAVEAAGTAHGTNAQVAVVTPLQERFAAPFAGDADAYTTGEVAGGIRHYVASGKTISAFDGAGKAVGRMETDDKVYKLHWWPEHQLLVAGCADQKVIAFDSTGARKWSFVSQPHPDLIRAAKQYWFASAAGHDGVRGLDSGVFLNGQNQLFVGTACTLEFLDGNGQLVKRIPQFWGVPYLFKIVQGPDNSLNLLASRRITDVPNIGIINNKTIDTTDFMHGSNYRFRYVPAGYTDVPGWLDQTRFHLFHTDVDGDGTKEIISEVTGAWNRVTVWTEQGDAKYNVNFGPGENAFADNTSPYPKPNIRGIDVGDVEASATPEIIVALDNGLVVGLDGQCRKLWSQKLSSIPTQLKIVGRKVAVGCEDGRVFVLSGKGDVLQSGKLENRITVLQTIDAQTVLAGSKGGVKAFAIQTGLENG
jgi:hypothetical protein